MTISEETLIAYLDNELSADERARVEALLAADAALRERLRQHERVIDALRAASDPVVHEALPDRLVQTAMRAPASWRWRLGSVLSRALPGSQALPYVRVVRYAAVLLAGVVVGWAAANAPWRQSNPSTFAVAQGGLEQALEQQLAADLPKRGPRVGVSFKAQTGLLCRTFDLGASSGNKAGIACRGPNGWTIETLVAAEPRAASAYETAAAAMPQALRNAVDALIAGAPLTAEQERAARRRSWRP
ncbi:MAG: hypothetical protein GC190_12945 [Alphaproteobacteria bacterium]|nr:hypothetical protein [Alphaproteobacteria bacterium]